MSWNYGLNYPPGMTPGDECPPEAPTPHQCEGCNEWFADGEVTETLEGEVYCEDCFMEVAV